MRDKIIGYLLLVLFSFFFFSGFFYVATSVQANDEYRTLPIGDSIDKDLANALIARSFTPAPSPTKIPVLLAKIVVPRLSAQVPQVAVVVADLEALFQKYSSEYGVDLELMKKIARCESGFNSNADTGIYGGMFQFLSSTWSSTRRSIGLDPNPDLRFNAEESIRTTAYMLSKGRANAWPVCSR